MYVLFPYVFSAGRSTIMYISMRPNTYLPYFFFVSPFHSVTQAVLAPHLKLWLATASWQFS